MGRYSANPSYGHRIHRFDDDCYRLSWVCDTYHSGSRLRHPKMTVRDTDRKGAERFAKKWGVAMPFPSPVPNS